MKLKTLKDLDFSKLEFREKRANEYLIENLKQEAIKWVKYYKDEKNCFPITYRRGCLEILEVFFNITESDLKQMKGGDENGTSK